DACVVDGPDLAERVAAATDGAPVRLGLDAVSGAATARLAACVADEGVVCNYGAMSGEDPMVGRGELIYRGVTLTGFMLGRFMAKRTLPQIRDIYADLGRQLMDGKLSAPVEKIYAIDDIKLALKRAQEGERAGKILVAPNGVV
ncbi:MAG TPA: zinc-binding dehydrogenase, partial [Vineibacter sp.]|nr:zinc-binding dehydrogenase [Vineibacter sp.]